MSNSLSHYLGLVGIATNELINQRLLNIQTVLSVYSSDKNNFFGIIKPGKTNSLTLNLSDYGFRYTKLINLLRLFLTVELKSKGLLEQLPPK